MAPTLARPASRALNWWICLGVPALAAVSLLLLELTSLDMDLAQYFYDPAAGGFIGGHSYFLENILHDRAKQVVIVFSVLAIVGFIGAFFVQRLKPFRRELGCLVLSLGLATAFVTPVKAVTAVQCPWSLKEFGGKETYSELLSPRPATDKPGRCWPGGHAAPVSPCSRCFLSCVTVARAWRARRWCSPLPSARCSRSGACCRARTSSPTTSGPRSSAG